MAPPIDAVPRVTPAAPATVAAVDLGSNSFHMVVARIADGAIQTVDRLREPIRLAAGLDADGVLSEESQRRACECLSRFGQRLQNLPAGSVRAVGTNTLRQAGNATAFLAAAEQCLGHPIEVISGVEEARLIYLGVTQSVAEDSARRLVIDIGGGSTELIIGTRQEPRYLESLHLGCITLSRAHFDDGQLSAKRFAAAELAARMELEPIEARYRALGWDVAIGASGTLRSVYNVLQALGADKEGITLRGLKQVREHLIKADTLKRVHLEGLSAERAPVFPGGLAILIAAFEALRIEHMYVASGALREGLLYDQVGRIRDEDVRDRSITSLAARYHVDTAQSKRVLDTALALLHTTALAWGLDNTACARLLRWAAQLHEIGLDIAHSQYHKHGAYIAEHADLMGFAREEQRLLAAMIRGHRRKISPETFQILPKKWQQPALRLTALLRLAVVLHRSRTAETLPPITATALDKGLHVQFPAEWLDQHPLTRADLEQEAGYLKGTGIRLGIL